MKSIRIISFIILLAISFTACSTKKLNIGDTEDMKISNSEFNSELNNNIGYQMNTIQYGKQTGTNKTITGLEPLPSADFSNIKKSNENFSNTKISHSYGLASNEIANEISINSQHFFNDKGFNALTVDLLTGTKNVYLTFDVGYDNGFTDIILDTLKEKNVPAAFFCTVDEMKSAPESIARMINEGHIVGNHTNTHPSMDELTREEMIDEIKVFDDYIRENFGYTSPYFRFPKGEYSEEALDVAGSMGYMSVFWSLAYADWDTSDQKGPQYAHDVVISRIHPGAVILLHAVSSDNAYALGDIIDSVQKMGYNFVSLENYQNFN